MNRGTVHEALSRAELWVGARNARGQLRVSGGPMLEWRPTLDPADRVLIGWAGRPGSKRGVDDDGDGAVDEEIFNRRDDDGDGEVDEDEDLGFASQQVLAAEYVDDRPEAVNYGYPNGEHHEPLGLSVHQECYAWSVPGYDGIAGVQFTITNHGTETLQQLYLGLYCDLDSRGRQEPGGHLDDRVVFMPIVNWFDEGISRTSLRGLFYRRTCMTSLGRTVPVVRDAARGSGLPCAAVIPLAHTTDPLAMISNFAFPGARAAHDAARAPARDTAFHYAAFAQDLPPGQGGPPVVDGDRYDALAGRYPNAPANHVGDAAVLLTSGPFVSLAPGQSLELAVAFDAADDPDTLVTAMEHAVYVHHGQRVNLMPDDASPDSLSYDHGDTGINGHEVCLEPPPGLTFNYDPHCPDKFYAMLDSCETPPCPVDIHPSASEVTYASGHCVWTDLDCDLCTGFEGKETILRWLDPGSVPPAPASRTVRGDHRVIIAWDNLPEVLMKGGQVAAPGYAFAGYRLYRLSDWSRESEVPPATKWQLLAAFGRDTLEHELPLVAITDSTLDYDYVLYREKHYPVGRYRVTDLEVLNGFDYLYVVTTVSEKRVQEGNVVHVLRLESPLVAALDSIVVPHLTARKDVSQVWVVPNPYRARAPWDRPPVPGDPFGRHVDFFGLPRARSTIRIYTVAGDLVAQVDHDGTTGDGQAAWNLISRNGQDVESGIYLFTVDSAAGRFTGRFVLIR
ncbi:MAG: hypothetical protein HZC42_13870 [Candidatus Eisenbacteria bacterium]|nr:hypothetical protein [Candidatus Eisenbacteria bacterium]